MDHLRWSCPATASNSSFDWFKVWKSAMPFLFLLFLFSRFLLFHLAVSVLFPWVCNSWLITLILLLLLEAWSQRFLQRLVWLRFASFDLLSFFSVAAGLGAGTGNAIGPWFVRLRAGRRSPFFLRIVHRHSIYEVLVRRRLPAFWCISPHRLCLLWP